jgi:hypothetical protein
MLDGQASRCLGLRVIQEVETVKMSTVMRS